MPPVFLAQFTAVVAILGLSAGIAVAGETVLFQDNFNSADSVSTHDDPNTPDGINANLTFEGRQSGTLGNLYYTQKDGAKHHAAISQGQLVIAKSVNAYNTPNHDFLSDCKGKTADVTFTLKFTTPDKNCLFANLTNGPTRFPDANAKMPGWNGVGIVFSNKDCQIYTGKGGSSYDYTTDPSGVNTLVMNFKANGADAAATADTVTITFNGTLAGTFIMGAGGKGVVLSTLYLTFGTEFNAAANFKQLTVTTPSP